MKTLRLLFLLISCLFAASQAHALPSFARQTGEDCAACHVGSYGPQLTPHGIAFKMGGYTDSNGKEGNVPLSAMLVEGFTHTNKDLSADAQPHFGKNDNLSLQELSVFLAGRVNDHIGGFAQVTGNDFDRKFSMDNMDLRLVDNRQIAGKELTYGLSINNNPTVQDPFNTLSAWKFPYMASELAPGPNASPFIMGTMAQQVIGTTAYALLDKSWYGEFGGYQTLSRWMRDKLNVDDSGRIAGTAPYWRLAYYKDLHNQAFHAGFFGMQANLEPDYQSSPKDHYRDLGVDASYQYLGTREHIFTLNTSYVDERTRLRYSYDNDAASRLHDDLKRFDIAASYTYKNTYGLTLGLFDIRGNKDDLRYNTGEADSGSVRGSPDSRGYTIQLDWTPWGKEDSWMAPYANLRFGVQYTGYTKFNGAKHNYDGYGRDASDNNTLFVFMWLSM